MKRVRLTTEAYQNISLHAAKYSFNPVFGYLLGTEKNSQIEVVNAYPVAHTIPLAPVLELSAEMAEKSTSQKIVGVYFGTESTSDARTTIPAFVEKISQYIKSVQGDSIILHIKDVDIPDKSMLFVEIIGSYKLEAFEDINAMNSNVDNLLAKHEQFLFNDFEDFLNSSGKDIVKVN